MGITCPAGEIRAEISTARTTPRGGDETPVPPAETGAPYGAEDVDGPMQAAPQCLHLGHARHGHDGPTMLAAQRLLLHDEKCEISTILETVRLKSSQEQARMAGLHAGAPEPC